jgi:four helix bundle protein
VADGVLTPSTVIAHRFEDLVVWQLADRLRGEVFPFTDAVQVSRDFKYCTQICESSRSAARNIAEGFGRFFPKEFRSCLRIAAGPLHETKNHLHEGLRRHYLSPAKHQDLVRLTLRAIKANNRLIAYLSKAHPPRAVC